jgi:serine/threonine protein phosphatase PrpC
MKITSFGGTDPGKNRANNEDAYLVNDTLHLYAVADGVGGSEGGEVASRIAVETLAEAMPDLLGDANRTSPSELDSAADPRAAALRQAILLSNRNIRQKQEQDPGLSGMGTTLTALLLGKAQALIANIGDSRAYLFRSGKLKQLTNDHSFVAERVAAGLMTPEQARSSPYRHVITRALGLDDDVRADITTHALQQDDRFLLCTDGLTEMAPDVEIGKILAGSSPQEAVRKLVVAANDHGGVDNITVIVIWVTEV